MTETFGGSYAAAYDLLYGAKDYGRECEVIEEVLARQVGRAPESILDLGCGTGSHAVEWAAKGLEVTGVDVSSHMVALAREKASRSRFAAPLSFVEADARSVDLDRKFGAVVMMFAALGYQLQIDDLVAVLSSVRRHLEPGSAFAADVWYGPAVVSQGPEQRFAAIETPEGTILKASSGKVDLARQICTVNMDLWWLKDGCLESRVEETHQMRFFFEAELQFLLQLSGFSSGRLLGWPEIDRAADTNTWNALLVATAV